MSRDELDYYRSHSQATDPGRHAEGLAEAPKDLAGLSQMVRNLVFHEGYLADLGVVPPEDALAPPETSDVVARRVETMLDRILERDDRPLSVARDKGRCLIGTCRDYAVLLCALLRHQGRPARARCGFARYFVPNAPYAFDHWLAEAWDPADRRWRLVDAEIDRDLPAHRDIAVDPLDISAPDFQVAGTAWRACRQGRAEPQDYGVWGLGAKDWWFLAGSVVRDLAALNKREATVFDYWGRAQEIAARGTLLPEDFTLIDRLAEVTATESFDFPAMRAAYGSLPEIRLADPVTCWPQGRECRMVLGWD